MADNIPAQSDTNDPPLPPASSTGTGVLMNSKFASTGSVGEEQHEQQHQQQPESVRTDSDGDTNANAFELGTPVLLTSHSRNMEEEKAKRDVDPEQEAVSFHDNESSISVSTSLADHLDDDEDDDDDPMEQQQEATDSRTPEAGLEDTIVAAAAAFAAAVGEQTKTKDSGPSEAIAESATTTSEAEATVDASTSTGVPAQTGSASVASGGSGSASASSTPSTSTSGPLGGSAAPLLLNRFSNWRQKANQNAQALWRKTSSNISTNSSDQVGSGGGSGEGNANNNTSSRPSILSSPPWKMPLQRASLDSPRAPPPPPPPPPPPRRTGPAGPTPPPSIASSPSTSFFRDNHNSDHNNNDTTVTFTPSKDANQQQQQQQQFQQQQNQAAAMDERSEQGGYDSNDDDGRSSTFTDYNDGKSSTFTNDSYYSRGGGSSMTGTDEGGMFSRASLQMAASTVLDYSNSVSVQAGIYRGRYSNTNGGGGTGGVGGNSDKNSTPRNRLPAVFSGTAGGIGGNNSGIPLTMTSTATTPSQTARILGSRQADHLQGLLDSLEPHCYIMLLGKGMLGVNLKQSFLKTSGTYVDYTVTGGAAASSGVVCVGDHMSAVGDTDVHKETIWTVPVLIAAAKRPVHLVLAVALPLAVHRIQHVDIVVAMMHQIRIQCRRQANHEMEKDASNNGNGNGNNNSSMPIMTTPRKTSDSDVASASLEQRDTAATAEADVALVDKETKEAESSIDVKESSPLSLPDVAVAPNQDHVDKTDPGDVDKQESAETEDPSSMEQNDSMELVQPASFDLHQDDDDDDLLAMVDVEIPIENTVDGFVNPAAPPLSVREAYRPHIAKRNNDDFDIPELLQACATNENFRAALRNAFLTCTIDGRRFPFLARHLVKYEEEISRDETVGATRTGAPNAMFMLFLEMVNFSDLYGVTPVSRRRDIANKIAHKFFLPTKNGSDLTPPVFDFHHLVPVTSLRRLEAALNINDEGETELPRDVFFDFQQAAVDSLSGQPFLSFLTSNECARMRAYLRGTAPFVNVPLNHVFDSLVQKPTHVAGKNYFLYLLCYLLCRLEKENCGEYDITPDHPAGNRVEDAACGICAALFIRSKLLPLAQQARDLSTGGDGSVDGDGVCSAVVSAFERFWEMFVAPGVGAIERSSHSNETSEYLKIVRSGLEETRLQALHIGSDGGPGCQSRVVDLLVGSKIMNDISRLADELLYDYAVNSHSMFRFHKFYEWMCSEMAKEEKDPSDETTSAPIPNIPSGCIKRLLRKADLPVGMSSHKPAHLPQLATLTPAAREGNEKLENTNAECAVVFGTSVGLDLATQIPGGAMDHTDLRRYSCQAVGMSDKEAFGAIGPDEIPATFESYAVVPPSRSKAFGNIAEDVYLSSDGWEATIINFMIPRADATTEDGEEASLFGVSLVFQRRLVASPSVPVARAPTRSPEVAVRSEPTFDPTSSTSDTETEVGVNSNGSVVQTGDSVVSFDTPKRSNSDTETEVGVNSDGSVVQTRDSVASVDTPKRSNVVGMNSPIFSERLQERSWTERISHEVRDDDGSVTVGIALVSQRNVIFAMRETLVRLLRDFSRGPDETTTDIRECDALVNILGNFAHQDVEPASLKCILEPFLRSATAPWLERPISAQKQAFEQMAGQQLIRSLPPVPLALLFVTALLEQKIVLSSSRRSILLSATVALQQLLRPLKWCHLIVPRVPSALAADLLQYPAPFILGMPSEDPGMMDLIRELPNDVTLVDLDVGRVILAPSFAHNSEMGRGTPNNENNAKVLRSQVLYLAQSLGGVFGARMDSPTWLCDQPLLTNYEQPAVTTHDSEFDMLQSVCQSFLKELLAGTTSCCYWAEEGAQVASAGATKSTVAIEPTVLFDEDRFFHVKNQRQHHGFRPLLPTMSAGYESSPLALGLDDFDLVLEVFLRCQCMNAYVSSRPRNEMIFSL